MSYGIFVFLCLLLWLLTNLASVVFIKNGEETSEERYEKIQRKREQRRNYIIPFIVGSLIFIAFFG